MDISRVPAFHFPAQGECSPQQGIQFFSQCVLAEIFGRDPAIRPDEQVGGDGPDVVLLGNRVVPELQI